MHQKNKFYVKRNYHYIIYNSLEIKIEKIISRMIINGIKMISIFNI